MSHALKSYPKHARRGLAVGLELRVCEYPTYARGFVVVSGKVRETPAGEACDEDGCCVRVLLEPITGEPVIASYTVVASADGVYTAITFYRYTQDKKKWVRAKVHEEAVNMK
jgi:hypothetical protein